MAKSYKIRWKWYSWMICILSVIREGESFNLDLKSFITYVGAPDSMFGFSVAQHMDLDRGWVIVGAPEAQGSNTKVVKSGAVYYCDSSRSSCAEIIFDPVGNRCEDVTDMRGSRCEQMEEKSGQWLGATVKSSNGSVLACAPRYVWFGANYTFRDPVGICHIALKHFGEVHSHYPCRVKNTWGYHRQGHCQVGFGAAISKDNKRLYLGAVGSWYWQGQIFSTKSDLRLDFAPDKSYPEYDRETGQIFSMNVYDRAGILYTKESSQKEDDSYLGYTVASINFHYLKTSGVVVGMPRGAKLMGKAVFLKPNMASLFNITGEQFGSYFGYTIAVTDLNGDGAEDILVGAPLHTDFANNKGEYETGRVYIYYQSTQYSGVTSLRHVIDGTVTKSRFGMAITALGDLNKDGYGDFAVGAPYDGTPADACKPCEGAEIWGAVYIYHGSAEGIKSKPAQIIHAYDISQGYSLKTFGYSLSGGMDLDGNGYPDLIVGAYSSDKAFYIKSRPVVKLSCNVTFQSQSSGIDLEEKACQLSNFINVPCVQMQLCLFYTGENVPPNIELQAEWSLDVKQKNGARMFFSNFEGISTTVFRIDLRRDFLLCTTNHTYLANEVRDKITPLESEIKLSLVENGLDRKRGLLMPILESEDGLVVKSSDSINVRKNCGPDDVCIPDLKLTVTPITETYILDSDDALIFDVKVENRGEDSFESILSMPTLPEGVSYVNFEKYENGDSGLPISCMYIREENRTVYCSIGNPMPTRSTSRFKIILQVFKREVTRSSFNFTMNAYSQNAERSESIGDNGAMIIIPVLVHTELTILGASHPTSSIQFNNSEYQSESITSDKDAGPYLDHVYTIGNKGPADILQAEAYFLWPSFTKSGHKLLYLLYQPETEGPITCEHVSNVNSETLLYKRKIKDRNSQLSNSDGYDSSERSSFDSLHREESSLESNYVDAERLRYQKAEKEEERQRQQRINIARLFNESSYSVKSQTSNYYESARNSNGGAFTNEDDARGQMRFSEEYNRNGLMLLPGSGSSVSGSAHISRNSSYSEKHHVYSDLDARQLLKEDVFDETKKAGWDRNDDLDREMFEASANYYARNKLSSGKVKPKVEDDYGVLEKTDDEDETDDDEDETGDDDHYVRKRFVDSEETHFEKLLNCGPTECTKIKCSIGYLPKDKSVTVIFRSLIWINTLRKVAANQEVKLSSSVVARITELPQIGRPAENTTATFEVITNVKPLGSDTADVIPLWIFVLSAFLGALILMLLVYFLYRCGFFKRNRPSEVPEKQPLNRCGQFQVADEAL